MFLHVDTHYNGLDTYNAVRCSSNRSDTQLSIMASIEIYEMVLSLHILYTTHACGS